MEDTQFTCTFPGCGRVCANRMGLLSHTRTHKEKKKSPPLPIGGENKIDAAPKGKTTAPWRPARITDIPLEFKDPRFVYRFIIDHPNSIRKRIMEQWELDKDIAKKMDARFGARKLDAGLTVDGAYRVNELILVRMPKEIAASRKEYYRKQSEINPAALRKSFEGTIREEGGEAAAVYSRHPSGALPDMNKVEHTN